MIILCGAPPRQVPKSCSEGCGPEQAEATRSGRLSTSAAFGARLSFCLGAVLARGGSDGGGRPEWVWGEPRAARGGAPVPGGGAAEQRSCEAGAGSARPFPGYAGEALSDADARGFFCVQWLAPSFLDTPCITRHGSSSEVARGF